MKFLKNNIAKLLLVYLCILVPLYIAGIVSMVKIVNQLNNSVVEQMEYRLDRFTEELQVLYDNFSTSAFIIESNHTELSEDMMTTNPIYMSHGIDTLSTIFKYELSVEDIFTAYSDQRIYSVMGVSKSSVYFKDICAFATEDVERAQNFINTKVDGVTYFESASKGCFIFHFPIFQGNIESQASINYCVSETEILSLVQILVDATPSYVRMNMSDGKSFYFYNDGENDLIRVDDVEIDNNYIVLESEIQDFGISVSIFNKKALFYQEVKQSQQEYGMIITVGFLISVILVFLIYQKSYLILQSLKENIQKRTISSNGFFSFIESSVGEIIEESDKWRDLAVKSEFILKQQIIFQVINGLYKNRDTVNRALELYNQELYEEHFCLIGVLIEKDTNFLKLLEEKKEDTLFCQISLNGSIVFIILEELANYDYVHQLRKEAVLRYKQIVEEASLTKCGFVVTSVYNEIETVNLAYSELMNALKQPKQAYYDKIKFLELSVEKKIFNLELLNDDLKEYNIALQERNEKKIVELIKKMNKFIMNKSFSRENKNYLRYNIAQPLLLNMKESNKEADFETVVNSLHKSGGDFEKEMLILVAKYCKSAKQEFSLIIQYIHDNYNRYDLSLEEVSLYGGFTKTYLSKLFKIKTGIGYIEYLSKLRMEKAVELLKDTDMLLKDVVLAVGYVDASAFRRKFKAIYGYNVLDVRKKKGVDEN